MPPNPFRLDHRSTPCIAEFNPVVLEPCVRHYDAYGNDKCKRARDELPHRRVGDLSISFTFRPSNHCARPCSSAIHSSVPWPDVRRLPACCVIRVRRHFQPCASVAKQREQTPQLSSLADVRRLPASCVIRVRRLPASCVICVRRHFLHCASIAKQREQIINHFAGCLFRN